MKRSGQIEMAELVPWIIGALVLIFVVILLGILTGKGESTFEFFKKIWRFGR